MKYEIGGSIRTVIPWVGHWVIPAWRVQDSPLQVPLKEVQDTSCRGFGGAPKFSTISPKNGGRGLKQLFSEGRNNGRIIER